jgi:hypothetical protein
MTKHPYLKWSFFLAAAAYVVAWVTLPHHEVARSFIIISLCEIFLAVQSFRIYHNEPNLKNRPIFLNFALFFSSSILFALFPFIGKGATLFSDNPYIRLFFQEYISWGLYFVLLALAIVYLSVDAVLREFRTWQKYAIAALIVLSFYGYYSWPVLSNPKYLYQTADIIEWKAVDTAVRDFRAANNDIVPTAGQIVDKVELNSWTDGRKTGVLFPEEKLARVSQLLPYTIGDLDYLILLYRPLYLNVIYLCVLCVGFILLFFGYQYMKDPPQGAYIERIMFLFLVSTSLEILHAWSFIKSVEWGTIADILQKGQVVSIGVLVLMGLFFSLRLGFIKSVKGEFYENELASRPSGVIRWRDALDNLVIKHFLDPRLESRRVLAVPRSSHGKSSTHTQP